ncbi:MAG: phosphatidate cytidylyltransferase [Caldisericia bacterium]|nr:phosphatidate cytidylyltransferase [Caldisericia bacterium]
MNIQGEKGALVQSELKNRVIGAIYFGLPFILFLYFGGVSLKIFLLFLSFIIFYEISKISNLDYKYFYFPILLVPYILNTNISIFIFLLFSFIVFLIKKDDVNNFLNSVLFPFSFLIISTFPFLYLFLLREEKGILKTFIIIISIWISDIFAYFIGKSFGKRKIVPHISPGKSFEGLLGSIVSLYIFFLLINMLFKNFSIIELSYFPLLIVFLSFLGDIFESTIKRYFKVKDSGKIILGHGGLFDRVDSFIFTIPILYFIL